VSQFPTFLSIIVPWPWWWRHWFFEIFELLAQWHSVTSQETHFSQTVFHRQRIITANVTGWVIQGHYFIWWQSLVTFHCTCGWSAEWATLIWCVRWQKVANESCQIKHQPYRSDHSERGEMIFVRLEFLSVVLLMNLVLWDVTLCQWVSSSQCIPKMEALQFFQTSGSMDV
jgi:hypothetical protein